MCAIKYRIMMMPVTATTAFLATELVLATLGVLR